MLKLNIVILFLCVFLPLDLVHASQCDFDTTKYNNELLDVKYLKNIDINVNKYQKWVINQLEMVTDHSTNIEPKYKKKFKAKLIVEYDFGTCVMKGSVRQSGDLKDHYEVDGFNVVQSLDVKIKDGNVAGITRFKMFIPHTRNGDIEVFTTAFFSKFDILSPRTRYIKSSLNEGPRRTYLFQEKPEKEFLEFNGRREGPVIEGLDDNLFEKMAAGKKFSPDLTVAKMSNTNWLVGGLSSSNISALALSRMNLTYTKKYNAEDLGKLENNIGLTNTDSLLYFGDFGIDEYAYISGESDVLFQKNVIFHNLLTALGGKHGLGLYNRKFYWNSMEKGFEPIYYDGFTQISKIEVLPSLPTLIGDKKSIDELNKKFSELDQREFYALLQKLGASMSFDATKKALNAIKKSLEKIKPENTSRSVISQAYSVNINDKLYKKRISERYTKYGTSSIKSFGLDDKKEVSATVDICISASCTLKVIDEEDVKKLFAGSYYFNKAKILPPTDSYELPEDELITKEINIKQVLLSVQYPPGVQIVKNDKADLLEISLPGPDDWILFADQTIPDITIKVTGNFSMDAEDDSAPMQRFNKHGITGCLNFYKIKFKQTKIITKNTGCEDAVNIVNSSGEIDNIEVESAFADAVDADFSTLLLKEAKIKNIGNDCLDFSYGDYSVADADLSECGDKAVSIGEHSVSNINSLEIKNSVYGVVSKDSSVLEIDAVNHKSVEVLCAAYNKKTEFYGATIIDPKSFCSKGVVEVDKKSIIK